MAIYERIETMLLHGDKTRNVILHRNFGDGDLSDEVEYPDMEPVEQKETQAAVKEL